MKPIKLFSARSLFARLAVGLLSLALLTVIALNFAASAPETAAALSLPGPVKAIAIGALIACLACLIAIGLLVRHNRTLGRLARSAETLASGDFSVEIPARERSDTLGLLAQSVALLKAHCEDWRSASKRHREHAEALRLRLACLEAAFNQSEQGLAVVGNDLNLAFCNRQLLRNLHLPQGFASGRAPLESLLRSVAGRGQLAPEDIRPQMQRWTKLAKQRKPGRSAIALEGGGRLELRLKPDAGEAMILLHRLPAETGQAAAPVTAPTRAPSRAPTPTREMRREARPEQAVALAPRPNIEMRDGKVPSRDPAAERPELTAAEIARKFGPKEEPVAAKQASGTEPITEEAPAKAASPTGFEALPAPAATEPTPPAPALPVPTTLGAVSELPAAEEPVAPEPVAHEAAADQDSDSESAAESEQRGLRVLLVERDKSAQLQALTLLDRAGHWVDLTTSGREAARAVSRRRYDAVLLDLATEDMTGFEFTRVVRALDGEKGQIPIVALADSIARIADCLSVGMDNLLLRPLRADDLQQKLKGAIASRRLEARNPEVEPPSVTGPDCNRRDGPTLAQTQAERWAQLRSAIGSD